MESSCRRGTSSSGTNNDINKTSWWLPASDNNHDQDTETWTSPRLAEARQRPSWIEAISEKLPLWRGPLRTSARWRRSSHSRASAHGAAHSDAPPSATSSPDLTDEHQADAQQHADGPVAQVNQFLDEALEKARERLSGTYRPTGLDRFPKSHLFYKSYILEQRCLADWSLFFPLKAYFLISGAH